MQNNEFDPFENLLSGEDIKKSDLAFTGGMKKKLDDAAGTPDTNTPPMPPKTTVYSPKITDPPAPKKKKKKGKGKLIILLIIVVVCIVKRDSIRDFVTDLPMFNNSASSDLIPKKAKELNGHYYYVYDGAASWEDAELACEANGGHLVTITSEEEDDFVHKLIDKADAGTVYLGLYCTGYNDGTGDWAWITDEEVTYTNWGSGEPNNDNGCIEYWGDYYLGSWNDCGNTATDVYVCEWDSEDPVITEYGGRTSLNGHSYDFCTGISSWEEAWNLALENGGYLAKINNAEEDAFLLKEMHKRGMLNAYFGLSDTDGDGVWTWGDDSVAEYLNWSESQPDCCDGVEFYGGYYKNGYWNDYRNDATDVTTYIIEYNN